jgi:hypothetical protein
VCAAVAELDRKIRVGLKYFLKRKRWEDVGLDRINEDLLMHNL